MASTIARFRLDSCQAASAAMRTWCYVVFGGELFRDCSVHTTQQSVVPSDAGCNQILRNKVRGARAAESLDGERRLQTAFKSRSNVTVRFAPNERLMRPISASLKSAFEDRKSPSACRASSSRSISNCAVVKILQGSGGKPSIRGMQITVGTVVGLVASCRTNDATGLCHRSRHSGTT
jgi:hypothetical protein